MKFDIVVNESVIYTGNIVRAVIILIVLVALIAIAIRFIWKKLIENEKLKYEFITIIAHKFRTPLTSVKWVIENSLTGHNDPQLQESFSNIKEANEKLINLTSTLIELTNLDSDKEGSYVFENIHICDFARQVGDTFKDMFHEKNIFFGIQCDPIDLVVKADKSRLEFVIQTLLENARNYTPPGRNVEMRVGQAGKYAVVSVVDNGIGIQPADLKRISHKFYRTENAKQMDTEGFGVGLYLANSIIKKHRGYLDISSPGLNQGSVFSFFIPIARR